MSKLLSVKVKAFTGEVARHHVVLVEEDTHAVFVFDSVAKTFTSCHSLSDRTKRRLVRLAYGSVVSK
jgi:hypothetical protein